MIFARYFTTLLLSFALTLFMPFSAQLNAIVFYPIVIVFSFLVSFLINRALDRKKALAAAISVEVSRLRRLHHVSENIGTIAWREKFDNAIRAYHTEVGNNFLKYEKQSELFRELSHPIYEFKPKTRHDEIIFGELLTTMREVALERQIIAEHINDKLPIYSWLVVTTVAIFLVILLLLCDSGTWTSFMSIGFAVASILFVMDLLRTLNGISRGEQTMFEAKYQKNLDNI